MGVEVTTNYPYFSAEMIADIVEQSVNERNATMEKQGYYMTPTMAKDEIGYDTVEFAFAVPVELSYTIASRLPIPDHYKHYNQMVTNQYFDADGVKVGEQAKWSKRKILNLEVNINHDVGSIKIAGSIPKFLYSSNLHLSLPYDIILLTDNLSKVMGVNRETLQQAKVMRVDVAANMILESTVDSCLLSLGDAKGFHRHKEWQPLTSIYWCNSRKRMERASDIIVAYDKLAEMRGKKVEIPPEYDNKNLLRIEERLKTQTIKKVFTQHITLSQLSTDKVFSTLKSKLIETFKQIDKHEVGNMENFKSSSITKPSDVSKMYISMAVTTYSEDMPIEIAVKMSPLNNKQRYAAKKQIEHFLTVIDGGHILGELNQKIASFTNVVP